MSPNLALAAIDRLAGRTVLKGVDLFWDSLWSDVVPSGDHFDFHQSQNSWVAWEVDSNKAGLA